MKRNVLIFLFSSATVFGLLFSCSDNQFDEHPPEKFLDESEQEILINKFIIALHDTVAYGEPFNEQTLARLREIFKLEYYVTGSQANYFMISENRKQIIGTSVKCYVGNVAITKSDTVLKVIFESTSFTDPEWRDTKTLFDSLAVKK